MDAALFDLPPRPAGPVRAALDGQLAKLTATGVDVPSDLAVLTRSLADRVDAANAGGERRGYVMLSAEYRAARQDLLEGITTDAGTADPLAAALADFRAATAGHAQGPVPAE
jgi:hypothetical protein